MAMQNYEKRTDKKAVVFGIEDEFYGMNRIQAIRIVSSVLTGDENNFSHGIIHGLDTYTTSDIYGREWRIVSDSSIRNKEGNFMKDISQDCELVTPILENKDIPMLDSILNELVKAGAETSQYNGLHVHASNNLIGLPELKKSVQHMATRQDLLFRFCHVYETREGWTEPVSIELAKKIKKASTMEEFKKMWYGDGGAHNHHYDGVRYQALNLHSFFEGKGIEFRLFNATFELDSVHAIIDLVQGFVMDCINSYKMAQYVHTDRTVYSNPDRMAQLLNTYIDRMELAPSTKRYLLTNCLW